VGVVAGDSPLGDVAEAGSLERTSPLGECLAYTRPCEVTKGIETVGSLTDD